jgi:hypothetical protein
MSQARQRWNRLFFVAVICWAVFCLFVQPILMAREGVKHFESDRRACQSSRAEGLPEDQVRTCLDIAVHELNIGEHTGFGTEYDPGQRFTYPWYFRVAWRPLTVEVIALPLLLYGLAWGVIRVSTWIWRGSKRV